MLPELDDIEAERIHGDRSKAQKLARRQVVVDMNPMVDLAFLLLTFFMLATTFIKPQAMELLVPAKPKPEDVQQDTPVKESKTLSLVLLSDRLAWYRGITDPEPAYIPFDDGQIIALIRTHQATIEGLVILVKPLDASRYENLVQVLDALTISGADRYALDKPGEYDLTLEANGE